MALTKKQKQTIKEVYKFLTVAEMAVKFSVDEKEIFAYLRDAKLKATVSSSINEEEKIIVLNKLSSKSKDEDNSKLSFFNILKENIVFLTCLVLGIFVLYLNSLNGAFVSDDYASITQNPYIKDTWWMYKNGLLVGLSNSLLTNIFSFASPVPFHLFSLFVYMAVCIMAFIFVYLLFGKKIAIFSIILFSVLPTHVEAVSWISGKPYILSALFVLLASNLIILNIKTGKKVYLYWLPLILVFVYQADRVRALSLLFLLVIYFVSFSKELKSKINFGKLFIFSSIILVVLSIALIPFIKSRVGSVNSGYNFTDSLFYDPLFQYPTSIAKYLQLILVPTDLTLYHTMYIIPKWLNWSLLLTYLAMLGYFFFKNKKIFFSLAFIFAVTAPSMAPVKVSWLVAERYVFLGSLGFSIFFVYVLDKLNSKLKIVVPVLFLSLVFLYVIRTYSRNADWKTNHSLWVNTTQVSPNSHNAWNNIGDDYDKLNQPENAVKGFTQSTIIKPNYADAYHNRANIFFKVGRFDLARDSYETALRYSPGLYQTYISLIQIDFSENKIEEALAHSKKIIELEPNNPQVYYINGIVYAQINMIDDAKKYLNYALKLDPNYKPAKDLLVQLGK